MKGAGIWLRVGALLGLSAAGSNVGHAADTEPVFDVPKRATITRDGESVGSVSPGEQVPRDITRAMFIAMTGPKTTSRPAQTKSMTVPPPAALSQSCSDSRMSSDTVQMVSRPLVSRIAGVPSGASCAMGGSGGTGVPCASGARHDAQWPRASNPGSTVRDVVERESLAAARPSRVPVRHAAARAANRSTISNRSMSHPGRSWALHA